MSTSFKAYDPERCEYYAHFTHHLDQVTFEGLFWSLFIAVILILFIASWIYQGYVTGCNFPI
jgi:hypothetical protein